MLRITGSLLLLGGVVGSAVLVSNLKSAPVNQTMRLDTVSGMSGLPANVRVVANHTVDLTIATPGHIDTVPAMVLTNNLAVATVAISRKALLSGSTPTNQHFAVTWLGRDRAMGFTIMRLGVDVPPLALGPLPDNSTVVAVAPVITSASHPPSFAWATTTLGDPQLRSRGIVSYLATSPNKHLNGFTDAIAVTSSGRVVAVLSLQHLWYSAEFVAHVAGVLSRQHGCHATLGVNGRSAQGGGALVTSLTVHSGGDQLLQRGDVITRVDGHDINSWGDLTTLIYLAPPTLHASVEFMRGSTSHRGVVTLTCIP